MEMVRLDNVDKKIGNFALHHMSFELPKGYILGIVGRNGAGKTTLLHLLLGLYSQDAGDIAMFGKSYKEAEKEIKNNIGYVLVEEMFCMDINLEQNGELFGKFYEAYDRKLLKEYCERFKLDMKKKLRHLSKGERLKFQFAFALSHKPGLLILDEPTANFDPEFRDEFFGILTEFVQDGEHSVILATHLTQDLDKIADYVLMMDKGRAVFYMDKEQLNETYRLVGGEDYKLNLLAKDKVVYKEKGEFGSKALVRHSKYREYDAALTIHRPSLEEIMYYIIKGGGHA